MRCFTAAVILTALLLAGCDRKESSSAPAAPTAPAGNAPSIELTFTYGSEKEKWIKELIK